MKRVTTLVCTGVILSIASMTPAFAIIHNSPMLNKTSGSGCPEGMRMRRSGHGAAAIQECVKKS